MKMKQNIAIIGGGISGISLAKVIGSNAEVIVFEQKKKIGGLISCDVVNGYLYHKVGGHVFNSKNIKVLDWFWQFFDKENEFIEAKRVAKVFINNLLIGYPIEDNLHKLDKAVVTNVIADLLNINPHKEVNNFEQFLNTNFGKTLYELYFKPYNEKIWNVDLSLIPLEWLEGKLPMPNVKEILVNNILRKEETKMVHSFFYYPKQNGSQFIIDRLAQGSNIVKNFAVKTINIQSDKTILINAKEQFDKVIFTGDVRTLPGLLNNTLISKELSAKIKNLKSNGTTNVLCSCDKNDLSWLYVPEKTYKAHRIIYTGNFSDSNNGDNSRSSCVVEFSNFLSEQQIKDEIKRLPGNLEYIAFNHEPNSYIIHDADTRQLISDLKQELKEHNIYLLGRFAEWEYYNMDKAIEAAFVLSNQLIN